MQVVAPPLVLCAFSIHAFQLQPSFSAVGVAAVFASPLLTPSQLVLGGATRTACCVGAFRTPYADSLSLQSERPVGRHPVVGEGIIPPSVSCHSECPCFSRLSREPDWLPAWVCLHVSRGSLTCALVWCVCKAVARFLAMHHLS